MENRSLVTRADYSKEKILYMIEMAKEFEKRNGSIVCRELLGLATKHDAPTPEARTEAYYKKRPCVELVGDAAEILAGKIEEMRRGV